MSIEGLPVTPHRPSKSSITSQVSSRQSASGGRKIDGESIIPDNIPISRYLFSLIIYNINLVYIYHLSFTGNGLMNSKNHQKCIASVLSYL